MKILHELCSVPTAPFAEQHVVRYVEQFVKARKGLKLSRDSHGNLLVELRGRSRRGPRWGFGAHMDHPGFVAEKMVDRRTLQAFFHGWVLPEFFVGSRVRFFAGDDGGTEVTGIIQEIAGGEGDLKAPTLVRVRVRGDVLKGSPGMWDQG